MMTFELDFYRKVRVWVGELPDLSYSVIEVKEQTLEAETSEITEVRQVAVELFAPRGGRALYGLLGAEFIPKNSKQLLIQVVISSETGKLVEWSLASNTDQVFSGLPPEFVESIFNGTLGIERVLGSGILHFKCAAHGLVGSAPMVFRSLAKAVGQLIAFGTQSISKEEIMRFLS